MDIAHTWLPTSVKSLLWLCRYYFMSNPLVNATCFKLAEYPITDIIVDHDSPEVVRRWTSFLQDTLQIRPFQVECGLDYHALGNCATSISYPFKKYLTCSTCQYTERADKLRENYRIISYEFRLTCPKCGNTGTADATDYYYRDAAKIKLMRWNVEDIDIKYNDITGECTYYYTVPKHIQNDIMVGRKSIVETTPQRFLQALQKKKGIIFTGNFFHFRRPTLAHRDRGWGTPLLLPVLKDVFYLQIMKKAQEAILLEHVIPLRVLFPQAGSGSSDPYSSVHLGKWKEHIAQEIARWRLDCVTPETLVEGKNGLYRADAVRQGDFLKNHLGSFSRVEEVRRRPLREEEGAYRLILRGLSAVKSVFSGGHPIWSARKYNNGNGHKLGPAEVIKAKDLRVGDYVGYPVRREVVEVAQLDLHEWTDRACTREWVYVDHTHQDAPEAFEYLSQNDSPNRKELLEKMGWGLNAYKLAQEAHREQRVLRRLPRHLPFDEELA
jgi:hypothetical protein